MAVGLVLVNQAITELESPEIAMEVLMELMNSLKSLLIRDSERKRMFQELKGETLKTINVGLDLPQ